MWWFMEIVIFFFYNFFAIVREIPSPKHHEIQEFAKNYLISAMKINKMFVLEY
jgi:ABC-type anion transport system duplicated permease subunit